MIAMDEIGNSKSGLIQNSGNNISYSQDANSSILINKENHAHEQLFDKQDKDFQLKMQERQFEHENSIKDKDLGWLGKFWGSGENSSRNIAAMVLFLLIFGSSVVSVVIYCSTQDSSLIVKIWGYVTPVISLALGYIFGKK